MECAAILMSGIVSADEQQKVEQAIAAKQKQNIEVPEHRNREQLIFLDYQSRRGRTLLHRI